MTRPVPAAAALGVKVVGSVTPCSGVAVAPAAREDSTIVTLL
jgi:hypothetical protein